jgi:peptidoglycan/LPS O-acetylase OafA/YrhL
MLFISNFVLDLFNIKSIIMKRALLVFIISGLLLLTTGLWFFGSAGALKLTDLVQLGVVLLLVGFAIFIGFRRLKSATLGEPTEDERSKRILQKAAALSYYISLYIWVFLIFLKDRVEFDTEELLGTGVLAMAATFGVSWFVFNFRGIRND